MTENIPDISARELTGKHQACSVIVAYHSTLLQYLSTHRPFCACTQPAANNKGFKGQTDISFPLAPTFCTFCARRVMTAAGLLERCVFGVRHTYRGQKTQVSNMSAQPQSITRRATFLKEAYPLKERLLQLQYGGKPAHCYLWYFILASNL